MWVRAQPAVSQSEVWVCLGLLWLRYEARLITDSYGASAALVLPVQCSAVQRDYDSRGHGSRRESVVVNVKARHRLFSMFY